MPVPQDLSVFNAEHHRIITGVFVVAMMFAGLTQIRMPVEKPPSTADEVALQLIAEMSLPPAEAPKLEPTRSPPQASISARDTASAAVSPLPNPPMAEAQPSPAPHSEQMSEKPAERSVERVAALNTPSMPIVMPQGAVKAGPDKPVVSQVVSPPAATQTNAAADAISAKDPDGPKPVTLEEAFVARVRAVLEANKRYPTGREASQQRPKGQVRLWFVLNRQGALIDCGLVEGSDSMLLDRAALATIRRSVFPPFPPDAWRTQEQHRFTAQLDFVAPG